VQQYVDTVPASSITIQGAPQELIFDPKHHWREDANRDRADPSWATEVFARFLTDEFLDAAALDLKDYRMVMRRKIDCLVHAVVTLALLRVEDRLLKYVDLLPRNESEQDHYVRQEQRALAAILKESRLVA
jgi:hypothetical protein